MALYPLKFKPRLVEKMWGGRKLETVLGRHLPKADAPFGESWEIYDFPPGVIEQSSDWVSSEIANGPLAGRTLHDAITEYGRAIYGDVPLVGPHKQFPALIKFLDAREDLSIQVHPDERYCKKHPAAYLKNEAWYVMQADPSAKLYKGFRAGTTKALFTQAIESDTVERYVDTYAVSTGDCHYLGSGGIHALGAGILAAEVQTPSDTTYRVYDFNRVDPSTGKLRTLHVEQALECIDFDTASQGKQPRSRVAGSFASVSRLVTCKQFKLEEVHFAAGAERPLPYDEPVIWIMLSGEAQITVTTLPEPIFFGRGETILLPAEMKNPVLKTLTECTWLEVTFPTPTTTA